MFDDDETGAVARGLAGARDALSDPAAAERAVGEALSLAPDDFTARLAAYRFYFYNHRLAEALPHADYLLRLAARRLNIAADWRAVRPGDAPFERPQEAPGLYLQALIAWGYCNARLGEREQGQQALAKVVEIDPGDRFGARPLLAVVERGGQEEET